jgi:hypothetical protein
MESLCLAQKQRGKERRIPAPLGLKKEPIIGLKVDDVVLRRLNFIISVVKVRLMRLQLMVLFLVFTSECRSRVYMSLLGLSVPLLLLPGPIR